MATTGIVNGTDLRIYMGGVAIGHATSCTLDLTRETRETLTKDAPGGGWATTEVGRKSATLSTDGLFSFDTANKKFSEMFTAFDNGTLLLLKFATSETGDTYWQGSGYITALNLNTPVADNSSFSATFTVNGAVTQGTNS
jgi:predicted secreted protein